MEIELYQDDGSCTWVVAWGSKGIYVRLPDFERASLFARDMITTYSGVSV
jgi:hypothetical protein